MSEQNNAQLLLVDDDLTYCSVLKSALEKEVFQSQLPTMSKMAWHWLNNRARICGNRFAHRP